MRDKSHLEQVERWARLCKKNPDRCKFEVNKLVDSQILMARKFYQRFLEKKGYEKLKKLKKSDSKAL